MTSDEWEPVYADVHQMILAATSSRDIEAILLGTAPPMMIGARRAGDEGSEDVAPWPGGSEPVGQG